MSLWESLEAPWRACLEEAWTAYCQGSAPIGAVVLDAGGAIVSRGRSRADESGAQGEHLQGHPLAHAETNALVTFPYDTVEARTCVLYTTTEPCPLCLGAFYMSGMREIHYASRDPYAGSIDLIGATPYMSRKPVIIGGPPSADLETVIAAWYIESVMPGEPRRAQAVTAVWSDTMPAGAQLGQALYDSGDLRRLRDGGTTVAQVVDDLAARLEQGRA